MDERNKLIWYQAFTDFFAGYDKMTDHRIWQQYLPKSPQENLRREYDDLFRGTNGNIELLLWASACLSPEKTIMDQTTLDVILFYYKWGYRPIKMEGNPPDYIGEQLRFLAYLTSIILAEKESDHEKVQCIQARADFTRKYLVPTVANVIAGISSNTTIPFFLNAAALLEHFINQEQSPEYNINVSELIGACEFESVRAGQRMPEIIPEPPRIVETAGINNCGGSCIIRPTVQEGCILRIDTDRSSDSLRLGACVRGMNYHKTFFNADRLRYPMKRVGERGSGRFERISWEEAAEIIAREWKRIKAAYGAGSRYVNYAYGISGIMHPPSMAKRLLALDGGFLDYYNSYSSACASYVTPYIYGTDESGSSTSDLLHTKLLILWGHNPADTIFGTELRQYIRQLANKGVKIIVIDPRYSNTAAAYGAEWIPLRPSTDSALADGMAYVIWSEGLQDQPFMDAYCIGFDEDHMPKGIPAGESYHSYLFGKQDGIVKTPEWAEQITGVPAEMIRRLARAYAQTKPACILPGLGPQRTGNGEQTVRSVALLTCLTGNVGKPGGGAAGVGRVKEHHKLKLVSKVKNPYPGEIPVFQWTKAVEQGTAMDAITDGVKGVERLESNIKMIFNLAGNALVNQHSDINDTIRILKDTNKCEFIVCTDLFMTASARYADLLLPGTSVFEGTNMINPWRGSNYLLCNNQVAEPLFECRFEWEWLKAVAEALNLYEEFIDGKPEVEDWLKEAYMALQNEEPELPEYAAFRRAGSWKYQKSAEFVAFREQIEDPVRHPFPTPSGKIEIFSKALYEMDNPKEIPGIPKYVPCSEGPEHVLREHYPLQLIGWHSKVRCHSVHDNNRRLNQLEKQALWIHPEDAKARGISPDDLLEIFNDRGRVRIPAYVTDRIMKGVVAMSQGAWYTPGPDGTDIRGSINVLTDAKTPTPLAKGNPQHTNLVEVKKYKEI